MTAMNVFAHYKLQDSSKMNRVFSGETLIDLASLAWPLSENDLPINKMGSMGAT